MRLTVARVPRAIRAVVLASACTAAPIVVQAQSLPSAKDLIAKYVTSTGGEQWKGHKSYRMKANMDMPAQGISASMEVMHIFPNLIYSKVEIPGMGAVLSGYDGKAAWQVNPMTGPQLLDGAQLEQQKAQSDPNYAFTRQSPDLVSSETVEKTTLGGQECYRVKHTWKGGRETFDCFSTADGLLVASQQKQATPMGELDVTQTMGAYKDFGGIKRPTTLTQEVMGQQQILTISSFEWDTVDPKEMVVPDEIKKLMEKK